MSRAAEAAYARIRADIIAGTYLPGTHLKEEELAARTGVSRTPVRDALRRLAAEGLVQIEPNHGTYVTQFTTAEIDEIFRLRSALEAYGASLAAERISAEELSHLQELAAQMEALTAKKRGPDLDRFSLLNNEFHRTILAAAHSPRLAAILEPLIEIPLVLLKHYNWHSKVNPVRSNEQHREIIAALSAHDPIWAKTRMHAHIISTRPRDHLVAGGASAPPLEI